MIRQLQIACCLCMALLHGGAPGTIPAHELPNEQGTIRNPLAVSVRGNFALTANNTRGSVSLVDTVARVVLGELEFGAAVEDVAWIDNQRAVAALREPGELVFFTVSSGSGAGSTTLQETSRLTVGTHPRGLTVAKTVVGERLFVACWRDDEVVELDAQSQQIVRRHSVVGLPQFVRVTPNGEWLVTTSHSPAAITVHELSSGKQLSYRKIFDGAFNLGIPTISADSQTMYLPHAVNRWFPVNAHMIEIGWVIDNRITRLPLPEGAPSTQKQMGLDIHKAAVGDACAAALSSSGQWLAIACGGTHEILRLEVGSIPWPTGDPGDFLPAELAENSQKFARIPVGGRPVSLMALPGDQVLLANALRDTLQVVSLADLQVVQEIPLHPAAASPELASLRAGETIFYDADRSLSSWYSCHTCHTDGQTNGQSFDTRNDGRNGPSKLTPSLRGVALTGPWTWHGWQQDLHHAMETSLKLTLETPHPVLETEKAALVSYLEQLRPLTASPVSRPDTATARSRGQALFHGKAGCAECHAPPTFTTPSVLQVGLGDEADRYPGYNPPSLLGLGERRRYLHDGRAKSLPRLLQEYHRPQELGGEELTESELNDLIAYLKSL